MLNKSSYPSAIAAALIAAGTAFAAGSFTNVDVTFKGAGWLKSGMVMHSTDTVTGNQNYYNNYNNNWMQDAGVLFTGIINLNPEMEAAFGIGAIQKHPVQGVLSQAKDVRLGLNIFSTQSRISWFPGGNKKDYDHRFDFGLFPYKYDNNIKNLGLYLIRGPVYPGLLVSGFEAKEMLNTANMMGVHMMNRFGPYTQDLVLTSEQDFKPLFDISAIYVGTLKLGPAFELGGGVNFYHYLPVRSDVTSPSASAGFNPDRKLEGPVSHPFDSYYAVNVGDSANPVYTWASHKGVKLMGRFALDPLAMSGGSESLSKTDLKLYGEVGVIGVKNYKGIYDKISERIPVMLGFNLPTFKILDVLALEVEYYGSRLVPDSRKLNEEISAVPQTPWINRAAPDTGANPYSRMAYPADKDDIKWSLYFSKVFAGHVKISGQAANDHFRTGGTPGLAGRSYEEALTDLKDWYWFLKLSYFF